MIARVKRLEPVRRLGYGLLVLAGLVAVIGSLDQHPGLDIPHFLAKTFDDFYANIGTELASIALTVLIIDRMNRRRDEEHERDALILQMGSPDHAFAIEAVRMLGAQGWLNNGMLRGVRLSRANLEGANLQSTHLQGARLGLANLRKVKFASADLTCAYLQGADLHGANLIGANLSGVNLNDANLAEARIDNSTLFSGETILPDCNYWSPGTDMNRYTRPDHPEFWRSHNPNSPASYHD